MRTQWRQRGLLIVIVGILALPIACSGGSASEGASGGQQLDLTMGGSSSSSSVFSLLAAETRLAEERDGAMNINIRESGASNENIALLQDGAVDFGLSGLSTVIQAQRGLADFEGQAVPDLCILMNYLVNGEFITVRADAGIDSIEDLEGRPFAFGFQGSAVHDDFRAYFDALGVEVEPFEGSLEDIVNAMKDGRIVGFGKSANGFGPDSSMLDVASVVPVKTLGFSQDQIDTILGADPINELLFDFAEVPAGSIYDNTESFQTPVVRAVYFSTNEALPDERAYRLTRSMFESLDEAAQQTNYAGAMNITAEDSLSTADAVPLCTGSQRYFDGR